MYCGKCDRELPESAFGIRHTPQGDVPRMPCKECDKKTKQAYWRSRHPLKDKPSVDPVVE